jgi:hypothetical protein
MRNLLRRVQKLEKRLPREPILLRMPDGSTERVSGDPNYILDLMMASLNGGQVPEMEMIVQSVSSTEPGGACMVDMARLLFGATQGQGQPGEPAE